MELESLGLGYRLSEGAVKFKRATFNQMVLRRRKQQKEETINRIILKCVTLCLVGLSAFYVYQVESHRRFAEKEAALEDIRKDKEIATRREQIQIAMRPNWADFTAASGNQTGWYERATDPVTGIPESVAINGEKWALVRVDKYDHLNRLGTEYCGAQTISYLEARDPREMRTIILHEIFHAGGCAHGGDTWWNSIDPTETKHDGIKHLGEFWAEFSMANPTFIRWLLR